MIVNCHTENRGDEAAVRALVDELNLSYKNIEIVLALRSNTQYPNLPQNVKVIHQFLPLDTKSMISYYISYITRCKVNISRTCKLFVQEARDTNLVLHAPGGPSIGDVYYEYEGTYLRIYNLLRRLKKKYMFYAPSMGPFKKKKHNQWRIRILQNAEVIAVRDPISKQHIKKLLPETRVYLTLDSAFQNEKKLSDYDSCDAFLKKHLKCIGITITDLLWHPVYSMDSSYSENIRNTFILFLNNLVKQGYGIIFIPQLYGKCNDFELMSSYVKNKEDYFVISANDDKYDAYFQQYIISKLYAVIGMRYHSNIFSAKMGTPFISISYEQKMIGFMEELSLNEYCIQLNDLSIGNLSEKFNNLVSNYDNYKKYLVDKHEYMCKVSYKTTELVKQILDKLILEKCI